MTDRRRYGAIEVCGCNADTYHLTIELWSEVEWLPSRQAWCIQDADDPLLDVITGEQDVRLHRGRIDAWKSVH